jgi:putative Mg2+ transporter-C (MgtC) family protein
MTLQAIQNINLISLADSLLSLTAAFVCGAVIGFERQYRQRTAGLRTNVLVAVGAAIFVDMANRLTGHEGAVHVVAYVVSGIGFLGAGVIMREEGNVRGLNTAATLWGSAAVGACASADLLLEAVLGTLFVLAANTLLRPVVNQINRKPIDTLRVEATTTIYVIALRQHQKEALALLESMLARRNTPPSIYRCMHLAMTAWRLRLELLAAAINSDELGAVTQRLLAASYIHQAFWSPSMMD